MGDWHEMITGLNGLADEDLFALDEDLINVDWMSDADCRPEPECSRSRGELPLADAFITSTCLHLV